MAQAGPYLDEDETRRALAGLLKRRGVECADEDLVVMGSKSQPLTPVLAPLWPDGKALLSDPTIDRLSY
jgi:hypothetical protein